MSVGAWCGLVRFPNSLEGRGTWLSVDGNCIDYFWILRVLITRWVWVWRTFDDNATQTKKSFAKSATSTWLPHLFLQTLGYVSCNTNNHPPPSFPRSCCAFALLFLGVKSVCESFTTTTTSTKTTTNRNIIFLGHKLWILPFFGKHGHVKSSLGHQILKEGKQIEFKIWYYEGVRSRIEWRLRWHMNYFHDKKIMMYH